MIDTARVVSRTRRVDTARPYINQVGSSAAPRTRAKSRRRGRVADGHACPCVIYYDMGMYTHTSVYMRLQCVKKCETANRGRRDARATGALTNARARGRQTAARPRPRAESGERRAESRGEEGASEDRARTASRWTTP